MKILAIDSSSLVATVAIVTDDILTAEYTINYKKTHSQTLLPMIDQMAKLIDLDLNEIDAIAVSGGPGSFTGLRIGSATAKGLGLALEKPIINVPTIDAMAYNLYNTDKLICPIMDARRQQVYTGVYTFNDGVFRIVREQCAISIEELIEFLNEQKKEVIFIGDGVPVYQTTIDHTLDTKHYFAPAHVNRQKAGSLGVLAGEYFKAGKIETAKEHKPDYLRLSQAERELAQKQAESNAG